MDFSKLGSNEKLAVYGAAAVIIGGVVGLGAAGLGFIAVLAAVGMLAVVFLPQMSPTTRLPGSNGSLMLALGAVAAVILVLGLLSVLGALDFLLRAAFFATLFYLIAVAGGVLMAWAGWREFQAEGGKFQLGSSSPAAGSPAVASDPSRPADTTPVTNETSRSDATIEPDPATRPSDLDRPDTDRRDEDRPPV